MGSNYSNPYIDLHERARAFMMKYDFHYVGDFPETGEGQQEKFNSEEGLKDKRSWLKTSYPEQRDGTPGLRITFNKFDGSGSPNISKTFWADNELSSEEKEDSQIRRAEERRKASEGAKREKKIADELADKAYNRFTKAEEKPSKGIVTYFSKRGLRDHYDIHHLHYERVLDYSNEPPIEKWVALIALRDGQGNLRAIQEIWPDKEFCHGDKKYVGKTGGCFFTKGGLENGKDILVFEGVATAISGFEATNKTSVAAMDSGNLPKVVKDLRTRYPKSSITICADNDHHQEENPDVMKNPGVEAARNAAEKYGCKLAIPEFPEGLWFDEKGKPRTDFDDMRQLKIMGKEAVKRQIEKATNISNFQEDKKSLAMVPLKTEEPCKGFSTSILPKCLHEYISSIAETTNADPIMITCSVLCTISSFVKKRMYVSESDYFQTLYPNLWMLNITKSGQFKTTALNKGARLARIKSGEVHQKIRDIDEQIKNASNEDIEDLKAKRVLTSIENPMLPGKITSEALMEHLARGHGGMILTSEFGAWLQNLEKSHNSDLKQIFTDLYDVPDFFHYKTKTSGDYFIEKPFISICGVSTLPWIKENLKPNDVSSGFFARYLLFTPPHNDEIPPALPAKGNPSNLDAENKIKEVLKDETRIYKYKFTESSAAYFEELHNTIYQMPQQYSEMCQEILNPYLKRWSPYLLKLAMLIRVFEDPMSIELSESSFNSAMEILKLSIKSTAKLFEGELGESEQQRKSRVLLEWLCKRIRKGSSTKYSDIASSKVLQGGSVEYDYVLNNLVDAGKIIRKDGANKKDNLYLPIKEEVEKFEKG